LGPEARNGFSLAHNGCSFRSFHSRVNVPSLPLRFQLAVWLPVRLFCSTAQARLAPDWAASSLLARCSFHNSFEDRLTDFHSPLGLLPPAGSKRSAGLAVSRPAFRLRPMSFRSPTTAALSKLPFQGQCSQPATSLPTRRFLCPFGLSAPLPKPVSPGFGRFDASGPLQFPRLVRRPRLQPPLPLRTFTSRRIKAFCWICCLSARLPKLPDFPSLPAAGFYY